MVGLRTVRPRVHAAVRSHVVVLEKVRTVVGPNYSGHQTWTKTDAVSFRSGVFAPWCSRVGIAISSTFTFFAHSIIV